MSVGVRVVENLCTPSTVLQKMLQFACQASRRCCDNKPLPSSKPIDPRGDTEFWLFITNRVCVTEPGMSDTLASYSSSF